MDVKRVKKLYNVMKRRSGRWSGQFLHIVGRRAYIANDDTVVSFPVKTPEWLSDVVSPCVLSAATYVKTGNAALSKVVNKAHPKHPTLSSWKPHDANMLNRDLSSFLFYCSDNDARAPLDAILFGSGFGLFATDGSKGKVQKMSVLSDLIVPPDAVRILDVFGSLVAEVRTGSYDGKHYLYLRTVDLVEIISVRCTQDLPMPAIERAIPDRDTQEATFLSIEDVQSFSLAVENIMKYNERKDFALARITGHEIRCGRAKVRVPFQLVPQSKLLSVRADWLSHILQELVQFDQPVTMCYGPRFSTPIMFYPASGSTYWLLMQFWEKSLGAHPGYIGPLLDSANDTTEYQEISIPDKK
jgi:hypothetical protein